MSGSAWSNGGISASVAAEQPSYPDMDVDMQPHGLGISLNGQHETHENVAPDIGYDMYSMAYGISHQENPGWNVAFSNPFATNGADAALIGAARCETQAPTQTPSSANDVEDTESKHGSPFEVSSEPASPLAPRLSAVDDQGLGRPLVARADPERGQKRKRHPRSNATAGTSTDETDARPQLALGPMSACRTIPPRPKPGRKPASEQPVSRRKAQNREAQRQFRHRKNEQADDLKKALEAVKAENNALTADLHREILEHRVCRKTMGKMRQERLRADETIRELSQRLATHLHDLQQYQTGVSGGFQPPSQPIMDHTQQMLAFAQEHTQHPGFMMGDAYGLGLSGQDSMEPAELEAYLTRAANRSESTQGE